MADPIVPSFEGDFRREDSFLLVSGEKLSPLVLHYAVYGRLNPARDNAILVCHALSGSARVGDWWPQLFGEDGVFDLERDCVIGVNVIGSCYGSTGPRSIDPETGTNYGARFPLVTIRDWVAAQVLVLDHLGIHTLRAVIGASLGGMQALQWTIDHPERVQCAIVIGAAPLNAMGLALNHLQRQAIRNDPAYVGGDYSEESAPRAGLALARAIAMCSYKSPVLFTERYARNPNRNGENPYGSMEGRFDIGGYLDYQGEIFTKRFDANSYLLLTKAMDTFDPARGYDSEREALERIRARILLVGISSDWLFPVQDVLALQERIVHAGGRAEYVEMLSSHGHDGFLADPHQLAPFIRHALNAEGEAASA